MCGAREEWWGSASPLQCRPAWGSPVSARAASACRTISRYDQAENVGKKNRLSAGFFNRGELGAVQSSELLQLV
jgi:hypothetical protein